MSTRVFFINSDTTLYGEEELNSLPKFLFNQGVLNTLGTSWEDWVDNGDLKVTERGAGANMSVDVSAGWALIETVRNSLTFKVFCQNLATVNLPITANSSGLNRIDAIIMRVDRSAEPNLLANNIVTMEVVLGDGATPLSDGDITTAIGSDDFVRLADITVPDSTPDITTGDIADTRVRASTNNVFSVAPEVIEIQVLSADPTNLVEGMVWFNSTTHTLNMYNGSTIKELGGAAAFLAGDDATVDGTDQVQAVVDATRAVGEANATTKNNKLAQSFTAGKTSLVGVKLYKQADTGTFTGSVTVEIYASSGGNPTGSALATVTITNAEWLKIGVGEFTATFASPYVAGIATIYHIQISTSTSDNSNHPNLGTNSAGGYASGSTKFWNVTDGWTAISTIDLYFKTLTTKVNKVVQTNSNGKVDDELLPFTLNSYPMGEAFTGATTPQPAVLINDLEQTIMDNVLAFGAAGSPRVACKIVPRQSCTIDRVVGLLYRTTDPGTNLSVEIQTNNAGVPSDTPITNGTSVTIATSTVTNQEFRYQNFTFSTPPTLYAGVTYWLVFKTSATNANQITAPSLTHAKKYASFVGASHNGSAWSANQPIPYFEMICATGGSKSLWVADGNGVEPISGADGFVINSGNAGDYAKFKAFGNVPGFTNLNYGSDYYLSNTAGTITLVKGEGMFLGTAISTTELSVPVSKIKPVNSRYAGVFLMGTNTQMFSVPHYAREDGFFMFTGNVSPKNSTPVVIYTWTCTSYANATNPISVNTNQWEMARSISNANSASSASMTIPVKKGDRVQWGSSAWAGAGTNPGLDQVFFRGKN
jgi:hypothetical protein